MKDAKNPWYREPWPWILMAGPAIVVVAGVVTAWLAFSTSDGLVEDDYYKQGLAVNQRMQRDIEAAARGLAGEILLGDDRRKLRLLLTGGAGGARPSMILLSLAHPTRSGQDQSIQMKLGNDGFYSGELQNEIAGRWHVRIEDASAEWRLVGDWKIDRATPLRLLPIVQSPPIN